MIDIDPETSAVHRPMTRRAEADTIESERRWIDANRDAIEDTNRFLAKHGLWSDGKRRF